MAVRIEKNTIIGDVLDIAPHAAPLFFAIGMHCLGCPSSRGETVEEACMVHGIECEPFLAQLNHFLLPTRLPKLRRSNSSGYALPVPAGRVFTASPRAGTHFILGV